jgi:hypothetical protein
MFTLINMQKYFSIIFLLFCFESSYSQNFSKVQIDSLVSIIDTSNYRQKTIESKATTKPFNYKGAITETYYLDTISKRLMKVEVAQALYNKKKYLTSIELTTYYYSEKLIMVKTSSLDSFGYPSFKKSLSTGNYYYDNSNIILSVETGTKNGGIKYISSSETFLNIMFKKVFPLD